MIRKRVAIGTLALLLAGCGVSPQTSRSTTNAAPAQASKAASLEVYDSAVDQASRTAKAAVEAYNQLAAQLANAKTPQERADVQRTTTTFLFNTLRTILAIVDEDANNPNQSKAMRQQIRNLATPALQPGGSPEDKIRYAYQALLSISVIRTF
ncbi:hypothetical protein J7643_11405 [bacterium]|nr:hypothetical protein [bacterium]